MANAEPVDEYLLTSHAVVQMEHRGLSRFLVGKVLSHPEQRYEIRAGRHVVQSRYVIDDVEYLIRVFVDVERSPAEVVAAYRTTRIEKYWRTGR